ncbi:hypothetical protein AVDCRST_MAG82-3639 [uncultured Rubrobacteraceae bacterium]|uniref:Uncharacterized protein n=1 Tax=uncultured Rubrobacteraceae bacterium TaxID=349277 RepID=A0A6J4QMH7_9ACTN|nr:hypothetical protein AVDCRST_MAG82-3639 [uncultured Rubrobacteraceae bacterium]
MSARSGFAYACQHARAYALACRQRFGPSALAFGFLDRCLPGA